MKKGEIDLLIDIRDFLLAIEKRWRNVVRENKDSAGAYSSSLDKLIEKERKRKWFSWRKETMK